MRRSINPKVLITSWDKNKNNTFDEKDIDDGKVISFSVWLNRKIVRHNLTPKDLACEFISLSSVRHWMRSRCNPREDKIESLCKRLESLTSIKESVFRKEIKSVMSRSK